MRKSVDKAFGAAIRKLRRQRKWTQEDLCERSGISTEHISRIENGLREACMGTINRLARAFEVTISELTKGL